MNKGRTAKKFGEFDGYLVETIYSSKEGLTQNQTRGIFLRALKDFFEGNTTLSQLEDIAIQLYYQSNKPFDIDSTWEHDLAKALCDATDLVYYYENREGEEDVEEEHWSGVDYLRKYYENNKRLLETKPDPSA